MKTTTESKAPEHQFLKAKDLEIGRYEYRKEHYEKKSAKRPRYSHLARAAYIIEDNKMGNGRINWKDAPSPKRLIFAYLARAEAEGFDIAKTTELQKVPEYRRVLQFVMYNIGPWKDIVQEYHQKARALI